jgi:hypothetical protein
MRRVSLLLALLGAHCTATTPVPRVATQSATGAEAARGAGVAAPSGPVPEGSPDTSEDEPPNRRTDVTPTWREIYAKYLGPGTPGACGRAARCHAAEMTDRHAAYDWLSSRGYILGVQSPLVGPNSCLRWFGGNMPPQGTANDDAARDLAVWVASGALDD